MNNLKALMEALEAAEKESDKLDAAWEEDPENDDLEKEWVRAYKAEHKALSNLASEITAMSSGKITERTARTMIQSQRPEIKRLIAMLA